MPVRYSATIGARIIFDADPRECLSATQLQLARGSSSTPIHENACPLLSYNGREDHLRRRSTRMPVRYSATMGARIIFDADPRECLSATQLQWACGSTSTPVHENACPLLSYNWREDHLRRRSTRMPVRYSATMGVRINVDAGPRECLSVTQLQWARGSSSTPIHENACPLLSYNGRADHLRRRSTRMPVRYSATMGARIIFDADPRECLSATQLQWACGSTSTPVHENVCPLLSYNGRAAQLLRMSTRMSVQQI